jgi:hypothetical protein
MRKHAHDGVNIGGNVFARNPRGGLSPYAPYDKLYLDSRRLFPITFKTREPDIMLF